MAKKIGCLTVAVLALLAPSAVATGINAKERALRSVAVSWVANMGKGEAAAACSLQVQDNVGGVPCGQLPKIRLGPVYCAESERASSKRKPAQQVTSVSLSGARGSAVILSRDGSGSFRATLQLRLLSGTWRVLALEWPGHRLAPAGLANEGPHPIREKLWPVC